MPSFSGSLIPESLLIVSAIEDEIAGLEGIQPKIKTSVLGVGNLTAALNLSDLLNQNSSITEVLFIGSCGTYNTNLCPFPGFAMGKDYHYREISTFMEQSHTPGLMVNYTNPKPGRIQNLLREKWDIPIASVNSPNSITCIEISQWEKFPDEIVLENMECFGLAYVCSKRDIGFTSLFAVTNEVGSNGSKDWSKNYQSFAKNLNQKFSSLIRADS